MIRPLASKVIALIVVILVGCAHPQPVIETARLTQAQLLRLKAQATAQAALYRQERDARALRFGATAEAGRLVRERVDQAQARLEDRGDAGALHALDLLNRLRAEDGRLRADPFALLAPLISPPATFEPATPDLSGLNTAVAAIAELASGQPPPLSTRIKSALAVGVALDRLEWERRTDGTGSVAAPSSPAPLP